MKPLRLNKAIGLALGETSALVAEVAAVPKGRPEVRQLAEFTYPAGVTTAQPAELGAALGAFLREHKFTARSAVVGLPARWVIAKAKDVPPADPATLADLLRLQAEGEFSAEQRDLVYDYAADATAGQPKSVLLIATPRKYIDAAVAVCDAAKLTAAAVSPSALALGAAAAGDGSSPLVVAVGTGGAELTTQSGPAASTLRHLRGRPAADAGGDSKPFLGELRRTVLALPPAPAGQSRQLVLFGTDADVSAVTAGNLGLPVTAGDLSTLGVSPGASDGDGSAADHGGRLFAAAVALAASAVGDGRRAVDFLDPRLAPPKVHRVPRWAVLAALAAIAIVVGAVYAYRDLHHREATLAELTDHLDRTKAQKDEAAAFVTKVSFAQGWHGGNPKYLACLADLTKVIPNDRATYVTNLSIREQPKQSGTGAATPSSGPPPLVGRLEGKTSEAPRAQAVVDRIKAVPTFSQVKLNGITSGSSSRDRDVTFSVTFLYTAPKPTTTPRPPTAAADRSPPTAAAQP